MNFPLCFSGLSRFQQRLRKQLHTHEISRTIIRVNNEVNLESVLALANKSS